MSDQNCLSKGVVRLDHHIGASPTQTLAPSPSGSASIMMNKEKAMEESPTERSLNIKGKKGTALYIDWEEGDENHPFNWSLRKRWFGAVVAFLFNSSTAMNATGYSTGAETGSEELGVSRLVWMTGTTAYLVPVAFTPLLLAPLSEVYGRRPLYLVAICIYTLMFIPQALAPNIAAIICSRLVQGCAGSVGNTMVAGSLADMFPKEKRSIPMATFVFVVFLSQAVSSTASAWTAANPSLGWRWTFWWQGAIALGSFVIMFFCLKETRAEVLLSKRARLLTRETGTEYRTHQQDEAHNIVKMAARNLTRPLYFFLTEPIVAFLALWIGFLWGVVFLSLDGVPLAFEAYGWSSPQKSTVLMTIGVGAAIGFISNIHQTQLYQKAREKGGGKAAPEARLYWSMPASLFTAGGLFWYAWGAQSSVHPAVPIVGLILFSWGTYVIYLSTLNYIADAYETYASSGIACQALLRNTLGGVFPLFAHGMYNNLSPPIASSVLGAIAAFLGIAPFALYFYGHVLRRHSRAASQLAREEEERETATLK